MKLPTFKLEEYFAEWEFKAHYLLCTSDIESVTLRELLDMADPESLSRWEKLSLGYTETRGDPELRAAASGQYTSLSAENILMFAGAEEGILCTCLGLLDRGDHAVVITPCYQSLRSVPEAMGVEVTAVPLRMEDWTLDLNRVADSLRPNTRMILINTPHNPTGTQLSHDTLQELVELAKGCKAYLFSDEVYRYSELDPTTRTPPIADLYERGISLHVLSKSYGLPGLRIGWIASQDQVALHKVANAKHYSSICNSAPSEILALVALRAQQQLVTRAQEVVHANLPLLEAFFARHPRAFRWTRPQATCTAFPELLLPIPIARFARQLVEEAGVLILPASMYDLESNHFRIGFGRRNFVEGLARFEKHLPST